MHLFPKRFAVRRAPSIMHHVGSSLRFCARGLRAGVPAPKRAFPPHMQPMCTRNIKSGDFGIAYCRIPEINIICATLAPISISSLLWHHGSLSLARSQRAIYLFVFLAPHAPHRLLRWWMRTPASSYIPQLICNARVCAFCVPLYNIGIPAFRITAASSIVRADAAFN